MTHYFVYVRWAIFTRHGHIAGPQHAAVGELVWGAGQRGARRRQRGTTRRCAR